MGYVADFFRHNHASYNIESIIAHDTSSFPEIHITLKMRLCTVLSIARNLNHGNSRNSTCYTSALWLAVRPSPNTPTTRTKIFLDPVSAILVEKHVYKSVTEDAEVQEDGETFVDDAYPGGENLATQDKLLNAQRDQIEDEVGQNDKSRYQLVFLQTWIFSVATTASLWRLARPAPCPHRFVYFLPEYDICDDSKN